MLKTVRDTVKNICICYRKYNRYKDKKYSQRRREI